MSAAAPSPDPTEAWRLGWRQAGGSSCGHLCQHGLVVRELSGEQHQLIRMVFDDAAASEQREHADANRGDEIRHFAGRQVRKLPELGR